MPNHGLRNLTAYTQGRVQGGERILENGTDPLSEDRSAALRSEGREIPILEMNTSLHLGSRPQKTQYSADDTAFARTGLAYNSKRPAGLKGERYVVKGSEA